MNEILMFLGTIRDVGMGVLFAVLATAAAFLILDRPAKAPAGEHAEAIPERKAA